MEIVQIVGIALVSLFIILLLKQYKPEFTVYISIITGILIFSLVVPKISAIIELINNLTNKLGANSQFMGILLKITGVAYLAEFATNICRDSGETAIASKVEFGAKVVIIAMSIPILGSVLEMLINILPK
ncbi:MAG: stage III sporulation protein AD [Clostridia bacterium]|nr:stage III sporulation protein AD [Clostridia bacterium]